MLMLMSKCEPALREIPLMICGACALQINMRRIRLTPIRRLSCRYVAWITWINWNYCSVRSDTKAFCAKSNFPTINIVIIIATKARLLR